MRMQSESRITQLRDQNKFITDPMELLILPVEKWSEHTVLLVDVVEGVVLQVWQESGNAANLKESLDPHLYNLYFYHKCYMHTSYFDLLYVRVCPLEEERILTFSNTQVLGKMC